MIGHILVIVFFLTLIIAIAYFNDRAKKCYELVHEINDLAYLTIKNYLLGLRDRDDLGELSNNELKIGLIRYEEMRAVWDSLDYNKILRRAIFSFKPITKENFLTKEQLNLINGKL